ncbi:MAG: OmpA family protein [Bacteroidia bacterium]
MNRDWKAKENAGWKWWTVALLLLLFVPFEAKSQTDRADAWMAAGQYDRAAKAYQIHLAKADSDLVALERLARCHEALQRWDQAEKCWASLAFKPGGPSHAPLSLANSLLRQGKYDAAKVWLVKYLRDGGLDPRARQMLAACSSAMAAKADTLGYIVQAVPSLNSAADELLPMVHAGDMALVRRVKQEDRLFFAAGTLDGQFRKPKPARQPAMKGRPKGAFFYDLPSVAITNVGHPSPVMRNLERQRGNADSVQVGEFLVPAHQVTYSADRRRMIFTMAETSLGIDGLGLSFASRRGAKWEGIQAIASVNGSSDDAYPFLANDSTLYFASNRAEGFGGWDIYRARLDANWMGTEVVHLGAPLNSPADEYGLSMVPGKPMGYFASNRPGGAGGMDIYSCKRFKQLLGRVVDSRTGAPLIGVKVEVVDINQGIHYYRTDSSGRFAHVIRSGNDVFAKFFHPQYHDQSRNFSARFVGANGDLELEIAMEEELRYEIRGTIVDAKTRKPIPGAVVRLIGGRDGRSFADAKGAFSQPIQAETQYRAIFFQPGYLPEIIEFTTGAEAFPQVYEHQIVLKKGGFHYLEGRTIDTERDIVVGGADVAFLDGKTQKVKSEQHLGPDGTFYKVLDGGKPYTIVASKPKYLSTRIDITPDADKTDTTLNDMPLVPIMPDKVVKTVHFAYRSDMVDSAGQQDLIEIIHMLRANPDMGLVLTAHTDWRGRSEFNLKLSQSRADLLADAIARQGIDRNRLLAIGKGEEDPFNNCREGVECSEELHAQNRRADIRLVRLKDLGDFKKEVGDGR